MYPPTRYLFMPPFVYVMRGALSKLGPAGDSKDLAPARIFIIYTASVVASNDNRIFPEWNQF
jgi:hypothetical protein